MQPRFVAGSSREGHYSQAGAVLLVDPEDQKLCPALSLHPGPRTQAGRTPFPRLGSGTPRLPLMPTCPTSRRCTMMHSYLLPSGILQPILYRILYIISRTRCEAAATGTGPASGCVPSRVRRAGRRPNSKDRSSCTSSSFSSWPKSRTAGTRTHRRAAVAGWRGGSGRPSTFVAG